MVSGEVKSDIPSTRSSRDVKNFTGIANLNSLCEIISGAELSPSTASKIIGCDHSARVWCCFARRGGVVDIKSACSPIESISLLNIPEIHLVKASGLGSQIEDHPSVVPRIV